MKPWRLLPCATAVGLGVFLPMPASAHLVNTKVGEFYAGMLHPLTSAEHLLPTPALAVWAMQCGTHAARTTLFAFPMALLAGTLAGSRLPPLAAFHPATLVVLVGLGGLLALGDRLRYNRSAAVGALALLTGSILGYRSGLDMAASRSGRTLRILAGAAFAGAGMVLLSQLLTAAALPAARGTTLPGQEELLAMLRAGELSVPLVVTALVAVMVWGAGHALGIAMVVAYSLGLAGVLTAVGLLFVQGRWLVQRQLRLGSWGQLLPAASALVILVIGLWLTVDAVSRLQV